MRWLRAPLVQFLLLGLAGFVVYDALGGPRDDGTEIVIDQAEVDRLRAGWTAQWSREPTASELAGLIDAFVREETLYREALALGLDRNDTIVRRRLAQKMEFLAADRGGPLVPDDAALEAFLQENADRLRVPATYSFRQVYLSPDRRGDNIREDAAEVLAALRAGEDPAGLGDPLLLGDRYEGASAPRVAQLFGADFAEGLAVAEPGQWTGPVSSGYGLHLVRVESRTEPRLPALDELRQRVVDEWLSAQRDQRMADFYASLRERYPVRVEADLDAGLGATGSGTAPR